MKLRKYFVIVIIIFIFGVNVLPNIAESKIFKLNPSVSSTKSNTINRCNCTVPDCVEIGDILFMDLHYPETSIYKIPGPYNEHTAFYIGNNEFIHAGADENNTVCIRDYSRFYKHAKNIAFVRVITADGNQTQAAVNWSLGQIKKSFQDYFEFPWYDIKCHNPDLWWFPNSSEWYCSELPWAAYYNQGIDIDSNGWRHPPRVCVDEIINDDDTEIVYYQLDDYIEILQPNRGLYVANNRIARLFNRTIVIGKIDIIVYNTIEDTHLVEFYIDGKFKANTTTQPYSWTWNEIGFGNYNVKVVALDENIEILDSYQLYVWKFF